MKGEHADCYQATKRRIGVRKPSITRIGNGSSRAGKICGQEWRCVSWARGFETTVDQNRHRGRLAKVSIWKGSGDGDLSRY